MGKGEPKINKYINKAEKPTQRTRNGHITRTHRAWARRKQQTEEKPWPGGDFRQVWVRVSAPTCPPSRSSHPPAPLPPPLRAVGAAGAEPSPGWRRHPGKCGYFALRAGGGGGGAAGFDLSLLTGRSQREWAMKCPSPVMERASRV